jgi:hypothetical protein
MIYRCILVIILALQFGWVCGRAYERAKQLDGAIGA